MTEASMLIEDVVSTDASKIIKQVTVSGQLDESNIDEKAQTIYALITQFPKGLNIIFDFEKLEYMNSKSIGYLTDWYGKVTESGGHIVIIKAKPNIIDILSVIGLTQLIPMFGTVDEAKYSLLNTPAASATPAPEQPVISTNLTPSTMSTPEMPTSAPVVAPVELVAPMAPVVTPESVVAPTPAPAVVAPTPAPTEVVAPVVTPTPAEVVPAPAPVVTSEVAPVTPTPAPIVAPVITPEPVVAPTPAPAEVAAPAVTPTPAEVAPAPVAPTPEAAPVAPITPVAPEVPPATSINLSL